MYDLQVCGTHFLRKTERILASPASLLTHNTETCPQAKSNAICVHDSDGVTTDQHFQPSANSLLIINRRASSCLAKRSACLFHHHLRPLTLCINLDTASFRIAGNNMNWRQLVRFFLVSVLNLDGDGLMRNALQPDSVWVRTRG